MNLPRTLGELRGTRWEKLKGRTVRQELRANVRQRLRDGEELFPGVQGFGDTVIPAVTNALLSQQDFILLGLRGQAKTRLLRSLVFLLDEYIPVLAGTELNDDPFRPLSAAGRELVASQGDEAEIAWLSRTERYIEKLATPDVTVADLVGDLDPIRAASLGSRLGDERAIHYGLLPRANRGIFAMNELPDLAGKVQVALFNILQEGDVQIRGYPVRLPLDLLLVFSANPEDYTARGKIITPLKDRIGSEIRTHYPATVEQGIAITASEAWTERQDQPVLIPDFIRETVERVAFEARDDSRIDAESGVSQRLPISLLELAVSAAERRALLLDEDQPVVRVTDIRSGLPAVTGRLELDYEGELRGAEAVAADIIVRAIGRVFSSRVPAATTTETVDWFEAGNVFRLPSDVATPALTELLATVPGLLQAARGLQNEEGRELLAAAAEFVLEGLTAQKLIGRSEEHGFLAAEPEAAPSAARRSWN